MEEKSILIMVLFLVFAALSVINMFINASEYLELTHSLLKESDPERLFELRQEHKTRGITNLKNFCIYSIVFVLSTIAFLIYMFSSLEAFYYYRLFVVALFIAFVYYQYSDDE